MRAWFAGDFEGCLELSEAVRRDDVYTTSEIALLKARALLRLSRPADAERVINDVFVAHGSLDASVTARTLLGAAEIRLGRVEAGLARLTMLQTAATAAHPTIRSEIALYRALAYYGARDLAAAEAALKLVSPDADIIYARALEYRGWIQLARGRCAASASEFRAAIEHLDRCRHADRFLEANCLLILATLADEMFDNDLWSLVERREARVDWSASGLALQRFWIVYHRAGIEQMRGEHFAAFASAEEAKDLAPTPAYRVWGRLRRAQIARDAGETFSPALYVRRALQKFDALDFDKLDGEERLVPLLLAEELAECGDGERARDLMERYRRRSMDSPMLALVGDRRLYGDERYVDARIAEALGDRAAAHHGYRDAFTAFNSVGYTRRAVTAALRLAEATGQDHLFEFVAIKTATVSRKYWVRRAIRGRERLYLDSSLPHLTAVQREVLLLICEGHSNNEIAKLRDRAPQTIKNMISAELLVAFGVKSRVDLVRECARRGITGRR